MNRYVTLKCMECNYKQAYAERFADGHRCPKCNSTMFVPTEQATSIQSRPMETHEITREDGLTEREGKVMDALIMAWTEFSLLDIQHPNDQKDFCDSIHKCQDLLACRIARRHYPKGWPIK